MPNPNKDDTGNLIWPSFDGGWWYFCTSFQQKDGGELHIILMVFVLGDGHGFRFFDWFGLRKYMRTPVVHASAVVIDTRSKTHRVFERAHPPTIFSGDPKDEAINFQIDDWTGREQDGRVDIEVPLGKGHYKLSFAPRKENKFVSPAGYIYSHCDASLDYRSIDGMSEKYNGKGFYDVARDFSLPLNLSKFGISWGKFIFEDGQKVSLQITDKSVRFWGFPAGISGVYMKNDEDSVTMTRNDFQWAPTKVWESPDTHVSYPIEWELNHKYSHKAYIIRPRFSGQEAILKKLLSGRIWLGVSDIFEKEGKRKVGTAYLGIIMPDRRWFIRLYLVVGNILYKVLR